MRPRLPVAIRSRLLTAVLVAAAISLAVLLAAFNVALRATLDRDATSVAVARAQAILSTLVASGAAVTPQEAPDDAALDAQAWIYNGTRLVEGPRAVDARARCRRDRRSRHRTGRGHGRQCATGVRAGVQDGQTVGAVVAGVPLGPYDATARTALIGSIALAVALFALIALLAAWTLRSALRPVNEMTRLASEWSEREHRPAVRPGAAAGRTDRARRHARPDARPDLGEPSPGAAVLRGAGS